MQVTIRGIEMKYISMIRGFSIIICLEFVKKLKRHFCLFLHARRLHQEMQKQSKI